MFDVAINDQTITVYGVRPQHGNKYCTEFLVYLFGKWAWIESDDCVPIVKGE